MNWVEQRRFERYVPPEGAIAALKPYDEFGLINDISRGGLAFECLAFGGEAEARPTIGSPQEIDIFAPGCQPLPVTLPCTVVRVEDLLVGSYKRSVVPKKRCGVRFDDYGWEVAVGLDAFLCQCKRYSEGRTICERNGRWDTLWKSLSMLTFLCFHQGYMRPF